MMETLIERFKPIIYVPKEEAEYQLTKVLYEIYSSCAILWYYWPEDDYTGKPDYEPVILVFKEEQLAAIGIRPHEKYGYTTRWLAEGRRPIIVFTTPWHAPKVFQGKMRDFLTAAFASPVVSRRIEDYQLTREKPPEWYVKDGAKISVYDYADMIIREGSKERKDIYERM